MIQSSPVQSNLMCLSICACVYIQREREKKKERGHIDRQMDLSVAGRRGTSFRGSCTAFAQRHNVSGGRSSVYLDLGECRAAGFQ